LNIERSNDRAWRIGQHHHSALMPL
jgi:hypothetical protein